MTIDVRAVNATVVGVSAIDIQCLFIEGSDVVGCTVVFVVNALVLNIISIR